MMRLTFTAKNQENIFVKLRVWIKRFHAADAGERRRRENMAALIAP